MNRGLEGVSSSLSRSRFTVTERAFSSTYAAPSVQIRSTSWARVNTQLRRGTPAQAERVEIDGFVFDFGRMEFQRDGQPVELSKTEQKLLRLLVENRGRTLPRELLLERVWDGGEFVDENALSVAVRRLRAKLGGAPIKTVYGVGYTWEVGK